MTIYVTTAPATVTQTLSSAETVYISAESLSNSVPSKDIAPLSDNSDTPVQSTPELTTYITMTSTSFFTVTEFTTSDNLTPIPTVTEGPYYFLLHDGTTQYLNGKEPPTTGHFVTSTYTMSVMPLPVVPATSGELQETSRSTTYSTYIMTVVMSEHRNAKTIIELPSSTSSVVKSFTGYGSSGWNITASSFVGIEFAPSGFIAIQTPPGGTGPKPKHTPVPQRTGSVALPAVKDFTGTETKSKIAARAIDIKSPPNGPRSTKAPSSDGGANSRHTPVPLRARSLHVDDVHSIPQLANDPKIEMRQVGSVVVVTMDGVAVSWTNSWDGSSPVTTAQLSASSSPMVAAVTVSSAGKLSV